MTAQAGDTSTCTASQKHELRGRMRRLRASIAPAQARAAADAAAVQALRLPRMRRARRIGVFLSTARELSTEPLIDALLRRPGVAVFVPRLIGAGGMVLIDLRRGGPLRLNRHRTTEPRGSRPRIAAAQLDVLIVPLLAFDGAGRRLGMGGGYYDRVLAPLIGRHRPWRVGYAYAAQQVTEVPCDPWDVPLHAVVTERGLLRCAPAVTSIAR